MSGLGVSADHHWPVCVSLTITKQKKTILFVCLLWHPFLLWCGCLLSPYLSWHTSSGSSSVLPLWVVCHYSRTLPQKEPKQEPQNRLSPLPTTKPCLLTSDPWPNRVLYWLVTGCEVWVLHVPLFYVCPKSACCSCVCCGWPAQFAIRSWPFFDFPFLYGSPYLWLGLAWWWALLFLQPILFPATISCHTTLSFLLRNCFASIWLGLFGPAVHSSPNSPVRPLVLLLHHWRAPVSHLFSLGRSRPVCFPWAS